MDVALTLALLSELHGIFTLKENGPDASLGGRVFTILPALHLHTFTILGKSLDTADVRLTLLAARIGSHKL